MSKLVKARVLMDVLSAVQLLHAGCVVEGEPAAIKRLADSGLVDTAKAAVAAALEAGAEVVALVAEAPAPAPAPAAPPAAPSAPAPAPTDGAATPGAPPAATDPT